MRNKKMIIILSILFAVIVGIKLIQFINTEKSKSDYIKENWIEISAIVNRVMRSGTKNKLTTILQIGYIYEEENQQATITRSGYKEGTYNVGDTIKIFINPNDKKEIK
jgi:nitrogen fixation protein FixH